MKPKDIIALIDAARKRGYRVGHDDALAEASADFAANVQAVAALGEQSEKRAQEAEKRAANWKQRAATADAVTETWQDQAKASAAECADCRDRIAVTEAAIRHKEGR